MAVIAVVGGPGAPGATTTALALLLAWPLQPGRRVLLVECDPDGGAVLAGALEGRVEAVYGLRNLAVADRRGLLAQALWEQLIDLSPEGNAERLLLPGLTDPTQAPGLAYTWEPLMEVLHGLEPQGYDVLLDLGRSGATGTSAVLARRADVVAATVRTTLRGLSASRPRLAALAEDLGTAGTGADALGLLLVAEGPYSGAEVSREFGLPVLGVLPHAQRTARVLSDGGDVTDRRFVRSELMRTARSAADELQLTVRRRRQRLAPTSQPAPPAQLAPGTGPAPEPADGPGYAYPPPQAPQPAQPYGPVPPVITTGPVAPLAGLAPQPAAPASFPGHGGTPGEQAHQTQQYGGRHSAPQYPQNPGRPDAGQPHGTQPFGTQPQATQPYGTPDDGTRNGATQRHATQPYEAQQFQPQQSGAPTYGPPSPGAAQYGARTAPPQHAAPPAPGTPEQPTGPAHQPYGTASSDPLAQTEVLRAR
ncbi:hypothetical protein PUR61_20245 [Streptomyces sp. BE20]|uniref:hypothetical protein n=1 Tax=Streptomyces sp. BE20 TaxID=3002525 RepID=UPI002E79C525|nr:hypothetical protein [Streptomyces sp. BE20]MEE1824487.1 hypothetical protein [Streptomyces sp. BE20]